MRYLKSKTFAGLVGAAAALAVFVTFAMSANAQDKKPIKIGFGMAQTGPLGPNGKSAMLAMDIWVEETNAKGGLLGRPVELVHYDDQSNPSTVPGIYTNCSTSTKSTSSSAATGPICWRRRCRS